MTNIMPQPYDSGKHRLCDYLQCKLAPGLENVMLKLCGRGDQIGPDPTVRKRRGGQTNVKELLGFSDLPLSFQ